MDGSSRIGTLLSVVAAAAVGFGSNVQGGVNSVMAGEILEHADSMQHARCGDFVASFVLAALVSFVGGFVCLVMLNICDLAHETLVKKQPITRMRRPQRWWDVIGGLIGSSIMIMQLFSLQAAGFALVSVLRAAATATASLVIDHVGCCGNPMRRATHRRALALRGGVCMETASLLGALCTSKAPTRD